MAPFFIACFNLVEETQKYTIYSTRTRFFFPSEPVYPAQTYFCPSACAITVRYTHISQFPLRPESTQHLLHLCATIKSADISGNFRGKLNRANHLIDHFKILILGSSLTIPTPQMHIIRFAYPGDYFSWLCAVLSRHVKLIIARLCTRWEMFVTNAFILSLPTSCSKSDLSLYCWPVGGKTRCAGVTVWLLGLASQSCRRCCAISLLGCCL